MLKRLFRKFLEGNDEKISRVLHKNHDVVGMLEYLNAEVSELRGIVRYLAADTIRDMPLTRKTRKSFDFQWENIPDGEATLSDAAFRSECVNLICRYTETDPGWFVGRRVLDAGCGGGRYTWGIATLGAEVVAVDQSENALASARRACADVVEARVTFRQADLLDDLPLEPGFDLVWCFGVLHHTGDTHRSFRNVARLVRPGGKLFLMIYGEPSLDEPYDFRERAEYARLRRLTRNRSYEEKIKIIQREKPGKDLHGWFDAVSPAINDSYTFEEIEGWLIDAGFSDIHRTMAVTNHYIVATRTGDGA